jgi:hypothetical protein
MIEASADSNEPLDRRAVAGKPPDERIAWPVALGRLGGTTPAAGTVGCEYAPLVVLFGAGGGGPGGPAPGRVIDPLDDARGDIGGGWPG